MNELLALNKRKLIKSYLWISGILTVGLSIFLFFFFTEITIKWILINYTLTIILLPFSVLLVWTYDWFQKRRYKHRFLSKKPYSELEEIGFTKKAIKANHNGLIDYCMFAEINECKVVFDINRTTPNTAEFSIYGTTDHLNSKEFMQKIKAYKPVDIDVSINAFTKKIHTTKEKLNSVEVLERVLIEFTDLVKKEKYKPIPIIEIKPTNI